MDQSTATEKEGGLEVVVESIFDVVAGWLAIILLTGIALWNFPILSEIFLEISKTLFRWLKNGGVTYVI